MAYRDSKGLTRRATSDFNVAKNPKYDGYQRGLASMVHTIFIKKLLAAVLKMRIFQTSN